MLNELKKELRESANPKQAEISQRFFKTGEGQYGEGDFFLGIKVPIQRQIAKKYLSLSFKDLQELLNSKFHEERLIALIILTNQYKKSKKDRLKKRQIFEFYLKNTSRINNWDLVDLSAPNIIGEFLQKEDTNILKQLAKSENLWERRIAIVSTFNFIRKRNFGETLAISEILLKDAKNHSDFGATKSGAAPTRRTGKDFVGEHDLIHKAVGWMLREIGKRNKGVLEIFLNQRYKEMPRTMLRYAIEKFPKEEREKYLKGEI